MPADDTGLLCTRGCAFGPVPSRRLGRSLGVNTVPCKTCTYSCAYCQLGPTPRKSVDRRAYYDAGSLVEEIAERFRSLKRDPDYVTFLGCGEPTLASNLGDVLRGVSATWEGKNALLTNGALLWMEDVRKDSLDFDVVIPTVSAGNGRLFGKIHRPHPSLSYEKVTEGMRRFAAEFPGELWIEVMLLRGVNDDRQSLEGIAANIEHLRADRIHLTAPIRPPTEKWVLGPTEEAVELALSAIPGSVDMTGPEEGSFDAKREGAVEDVLDTARVHPMREEQFFQAFDAAGISQGEAFDILKRLLDDGSMTMTEHRGKRFYRAKG